MTLNKIPSLAQPLSDNDLLSEIFEQSDRFTEIKKTAFREFYQNNVLPNFAEGSEPVKSSFGFSWLGFLQSFGAMCLITLFLASAWVGAQSVGLVSGSITNKLADNTQITSFEDCRQNGGQITNDQKTCTLGSSYFIESNPIQDNPKNTQNSNSSDSKSNSVTESQTSQNNGSLKSCPAEIKYCLDGSIVSRDPSNSCSFMPCPDQQLQAQVGR